MVLPNRSPGAWPGQGLGLMALTKLLPSPSFPEKGSQCHSLSFCSDLEGGGVGLASGMDSPLWKGLGAGGGGEGHCLRKVGLDH